MFSLAVTHHAILYSKKAFCRVKHISNANYTTSKPSVQGDNPPPGRRRKEKIKFLLDKFLKNRKTSSF